MFQKSLASFISFGRAKILCGGVSLLLLARVNGEDFPPVRLTVEERRVLYQQVRVTPCAQQMGLSCAFFANVPLVTMSSGINIADGSEASRQFISSIYGLRKGDFKFTSAFDREMFFQIFAIPAKSINHYYRDAKREDLLADAKMILTTDINKALDQGMFASLRIKGAYGTPHNVLLLAYREDNYYCHDPIIGNIIILKADELASRILCLSKARSKESKRYYTAYHLVSLTAPSSVDKSFLSVTKLANDQEIKLADTQQKSLSAVLRKVEGKDGVVESFPSLRFAVFEKTGKSVISSDLPVESMQGVHNLTKFSVSSYALGKRDMLPVWLIDGVPLVAIGYIGGDNPKVIFFDGKQRTVMPSSDALKAFKKSGCYFGYVMMPK